MTNENISESGYAELMRSLEMQNEEYINLLNSKEYRLGSVLLRIKECVTKGKWKSILGFLRNITAERKFNNIQCNKQTFNRKETCPKDYFSTERIAVYTVIFGRYDHIQEPVCFPKNIDYYIITDQKVPSDSKWKQIEWRGKCDESLTDVEKNRYFKMHPEVFFPEYKYSIYIDGNIKIITDLTPYIKLIGDSGLALHYHSSRDCVYNELEGILISHKAKKNAVEAYLKFLREKNMPEHYGLLECNVIVREHDNKVCQKIMNEWWEMFIDHIKRDQVLLPYVLYSNQIEVESISTLGNNVYENRNLRINYHVLS